MSDPLRDERFPDRPQTDDFWRLSDSVLYIDGEAEHRPVDDIINEFIDFDSALYMAQGRVNRLLMTTEITSTSLPRIMASLYLDALIAGARFQKLGGKRPATTTEGEAP